MVWHHMHIHHTGQPTMPQNHWLTCIVIWSKERNEDLPSIYVFLFAYKVHWIGEVHYVAFALCCCFWNNDRWLQNVPSSHFYFWIPRCNQWFTFKRRGVLWSSSKHLCVYESLSVASKIMYFCCDVMVRTSHRWNTKDSYLFLLLYSQNYIVQEALTLSWFCLHTIEYPSVKLGFSFTVQVVRSCNLIRTTSQFASVKNIAQVLQ